MKKKESKFGKMLTKEIRLCVVLIIIVFIISTVFISGCAERRQNATITTAVEAASKTERAVFAIEGMSCTSCAKGIKAMLKRTPGVVSAEVSFERKEAVVEFNPAETSRKKIVEAINDMGYRATIKK